MLNGYTPSQVGDVADHTPSSITFMHILSLSPLKKYPTSQLNDTIVCRSYSRSPDSFSTGVVLYSVLPLLGTATGAQVTACQ